MGGGASRHLELKPVPLSAKVVIVGARWRSGERDLRAREPKVQLFRVQAVTAGSDAGGLPPLLNSSNLVETKNHDREQVNDGHKQQQPHPAYRPRDARGRVGRHSLSLDSLRVRGPTARRTHARRRVRRVKRETVYEPFRKATGIEIVPVPATVAKLLAMFRSGRDGQPEVAGRPVEHAPAAAQDGRAPALGEGFQVGPRVGGQGRGGEPVGHPATLTT